MAKCSWC